MGLNASGHSPGLMTPDQYKGQDKMPNVGWGSVTTPGAVSLWMELHERYGKLPFGDLFEPAIKYASDGFRVSYMISRQWKRAVDRLKGPGELGEGVPNRRLRAQAGRVVEISRPGKDAHQNRREQGRGLLSR